MVLRKIFMLFSAIMLACTLAVAQSSQDQNKDAGKSSKDQSKDSKESKDDDSFYHNTGINDLNAIGTRNVGCNRGMFNWYSLDSQVKMGREFSQQVEQSSHLITDPVVNEYVNRVAQNLARNSDSHLPFTIKILDVEDPNAFALPGGYLYIHAGTILLAEDESELAGVIAHEIGHVAACHAARGQTRGTLASIAMIPVIVMTGGLAGIGINEAANLAIPATFSKFSRGFEAQADYLGIQYAYKTGYDPNGMINFFERLQVVYEKRKVGLTQRVYGDHPQSVDRIQKSQQEINTILPPREQYIVDTSEFQQAKKRLALIMKHRKLNDGKEETPDLRRTVDDTNQKDKDKDDSDRPVIKRKDSSQ